MMNLAQELANAYEAIAGVLHYTNECGNRDAAATLLKNYISQCLEDEESDDKASK